jgi:hypothetical protein
MESVPDIGRRINQDTMMSTVITSKAVFIPNLIIFLVVLEFMLLLPNIIAKESVILALVPLWVLVLLKHLVEAMDTDTTLITLGAETLVVTTTVIGTTRVMDGLSLVQDLVL